VRPWGEWLAVGARGGVERPRAEAVVRPSGQAPPRPGPTRLPDVPPGGIARVVSIDASARGCRERLQAYGLAPGREVEVVQHAPVTVVRVDHVDLAFEAGIARGIIVSTGAEPAPERPESAC